MLWKEFFFFAFFGPFFFYAGSKRAHRVVYPTPEMRGLAACRGLHAAYTQDTANRGAAT